MTDPGAADERFNPAALDMLRRLGKGQLLVRMIDIFLSKAPERLGAARTAFQTDDMHAVEMVVHSMKSSAAQLGGASVQRHAAIAEKAASLGDRATVSAQLDIIDVEFASLQAWLEQAKADAVNTLDENPQ